MNASVLTALGAILVAMVSLIIGIANLIAGRGGQRADAAQKITGAATDLVEELRESYEVLKVEVTKLRTLLRRWVRAHDLNDAAATESVANDAREFLG